MRRLILVALALLSAGCAEDNPTIGASETTTEEQPAPEPGGDIAVTAVEYEFQGMPETLTAGEVTFTFANAGQEEHEIQLVLITGDQPIEELIELPGPQSEEFIQPIDRASATPGGTDEFTAELQPGRYGYACFVKAKDGTEHAVLGMRGELTVA